MFSKRTNWNFKESNFWQAYHRLKAAGVDVIDLSESNPTRCEFQYIKHLLSPRKENLSNIYEPSPKGLIEARKVIAEYYVSKHTPVDIDQIFLTASTSEAYSFLFRMLCDPNDQILIPQPSYPLLNYLGELNDIELGTYCLRYKQGRWNIDLIHLESCVTKNTKAIVFIHPNNPTGSFVKKEELNAVMKIAKKHSLALISDEVFSDYAYFDDPERVSSLSAENEVLTFTLNGISKMLGLPQMKLGWITINGPTEEQAQAVKRLEMICDTFLSVNTPSQEALSHWFSNKALVQKEIMARIEKNRAFLLEQFLKPHAANYLHCEGGWYVTLRIPKTKTEEEWVMEFLDQDHVFIQPGYFFDFEEEAYLVASLLTPEKKFKEGCLKILNRVSAG